MTDPRNKIYVDRLADEWAKHGKIILSLDWDSTLSPYETVDNPDDIKRAIWLVKECQLVGCYNMIHTACRQDRYDEIRRACDELGIRIDSINQTPIDLPYGKAGSKPYFNHGLCDRHALPAALDILEEAMYKQRAKKYGEGTNYPGWSGF